MVKRRFTANCSADITISLPSRTSGVMLVARGGGEGTLGSTASTPPAAADRPAQRSRVI
jgi:hypothetical protein